MGHGLHRLRYQAGRPEISSQATSQSATLLKAQHSRAKHTLSIQRISLTSFLLFATLAYQPLAHAQLSREAWLDRMSTVIPAMFCQPTPYFRACFSVSAQACEEATASAARVCIRQHRDSVPDPLNRADAGKQGSVLGACTGTAYEAMLAIQRLSNERCNDPNNWR